MAGYLPDEIKDAGAFEKWAASTFSHTQIARGDVPVRLKIPFTVENGELNISTIDTERAGFGPFYSGLLLCACAIIGVFCYKKRKSDSTIVHVLLACLLACVVLIGIIDASWVARYSPFMWFPIVCAATIAPFMQHTLSKNPKRIATIAMAGLTLVIAVNNTMFLRFSYITLSESKNIDMAFSNLQVAGDVAVAIPYYSGTVFNLQDKHIQYMMSPEIVQAEMVEYVDGIYWIPLREER